MKFTCSSGDPSKVHINITSISKLPFPPLLLTTPTSSPYTPSPVTLLSLCSMPETGKQRQDKEKGRLDSGDVISASQAPLQLVADKVQQLWEVGAPFLECHHVAVEGCFVSLAKHACHQCAWSEKNNKHMSGEPLTLTTNSLSTDTPGGQRYNTLKITITCLTLS